MTQETWCSTIDKRWQSWMGQKMPLCRWHNFWMAPCLICYFAVIFVLYWEKVASYEKFNHKSKLYGKFQRFHAIYGSVEILKIVELLKISIKWKIVKHFTRLKQRAALKKIILPLHKKWNLTASQQQKFVTEIYRNIQTFAFKVLQECSPWAFKKWCSGNVFSDTKQKNLGLKICKVWRFLDALRECIIFNVKWVEVLKMSEVFWAKLYCKLRDLFS